MHDTALIPLTQAQEQEGPSSSEVVAQRLISLLEELQHLAPTQPEEPSQQVAVVPKRQRGRPASLPLPQLWLALLLGLLRQAKHLSTIWRWLCLQPTGSFAPVQVSYQAMRQRLLRAGAESLQQLFQTLTQALGQWDQAHPTSAVAVASFASAIVALDETTLDRLRRLTEDLRGLPDGDPHLLPGKLAGLFDLRTQRWVRLQFRADVLAACNTAVLLLLEGLAPGSLILADLGYFSFPWFDYLTGQGYYWVSRLKEKTSYQIQEVLAYDDHTGLLDAIVWLGAYRADRAASAVRLLEFTWQGRQYRYLTNVLDPTQLSGWDIAYLYSRRWDIELAFKLLKCQLGLHLWWGARRELVLIQLWLALILAQLLHALQLHVALQAEVEPFDVSLPILLDLLPLVPAGPTSWLVRLVEQGRSLGLIRPSRRHQVVVPQEPSRALTVKPCLSRQPRAARYAQRNPHPRTTPFRSSFLTQLLI